MLFGVSVSVCVCCLASAISMIRLDGPENGISVITVMPVAQYCICLKPWCVCGHEELCLRSGGC